METILCPTDFSKNASNAAAYACALGEKFKARIILLHVYESPAVMTEVEFTMIRDAEAMIKEGAAKQLDALKLKLSKKFPKVSLETTLVMGAGYDEVISLAAKK